MNETRNMYPRDARKALWASPRRRLTTMALAAVFLAASVALWVLVAPVAVVGVAIVMAVTYGLLGRRWATDDAIQAASDEPVSI